MTMIATEQMSLLMSASYLMCQFCVQLALLLNLVLSVSFDMVRLFITRRHESSLMKCLLHGDKAFYGTQYQNVATAVIVP